MTKMHFVRAAELVKGHLDHGYTPLSYYNVEVEQPGNGNIDAAQVRATWMAEAFISLFREYNPRFNQVKFLKACGLGEK